MNEIRTGPIQGDRTLAKIHERTEAAVTSIAKLYDLMRAARDLGYSEDELADATRISLATLRSILDGANPPLLVERGLPDAYSVDRVGPTPKPEPASNLNTSNGPAVPTPLSDGQRNHTSAKTVNLNDDDSRVLTLSIVEDLKGKGYNQSQIAEMYGVTRQYVSWIKHTYGGRLTPRESVRKSFPWAVQERFTRSSLYKLLRHHGEYMASGGAGMSEDKLKRLRSFYRKLRVERLIIEFDPSNPPVPGVSGVGGFVYRPRNNDDGDLLVRVGDGTQLTEEQKRLWRFPEGSP